MSNNRSKEEIIAKMLTVAASSISVKKTIIMYGAAMNFAQLQKYMSLVEDNGLLARTSDGEWRITAKAEDYLKAYDTIQQMIRPKEQESAALAAQIV